MIRKRQALSPSSGKKIPNGGGKECNPKGDEGSNRSKGEEMLALEAGSISSAGAADELLARAKAEDRTRTRGFLAEKEEGGFSLSSYQFEQLKASGLGPLLEQRQAGFLPQPRVEAGRQGR